MCDHAPYTTMRSLEKSCTPMVGLLNGSPNVTPPSQDEIQSANPLAGGCLIKGLRDRNSPRYRFVIPQPPTSEAVSTPDLIVGGV